jgi:hypothetical protein
MFCIKAVVMVGYDFVLIVMRRLRKATFLLGEAGKD